MTDTTTVVTDWPVVAAKVTKTIAATDASWFASHPGRIFHEWRTGHGHWIVRRIFRSPEPDLLLRVHAKLIEPPPEDTDAALGELWCRVAYHAQDPDRIASWTRRALLELSP